MQKIGNNIQKTIIHFEFFKHFFILKNTTKKYKRLIQNCKWKYTTHILAVMSDP